MISDKVARVLDPINRFIFDHLYFIGIFVLLIIMYHIINKTRSYMIKRRADRLGNYDTNEWFKK